MNPRDTGLVRGAILMLTLAVLPSPSALCQSPPTELNPERPAVPSTNLLLGERFWIGGRYDGSRVIVYFDAVKFNGTKHLTCREATAARG